MEGEDFGREWWIILHRQERCRKSQDFLKFQIFGGLIRKDLMVQAFVLYLVLVACFTLFGAEKTL